MKHSASYWNDKINNAGIARNGYGDTARKLEALELAEDHPGHAVVADAIGLLWALYEDADADVDDAIAGASDDGWTYETLEAALEADTEAGR